MNTKNFNKYYLVRLFLLAFSLCYSQILKTGDTLSDNSNLLFGIVSKAGTILDKGCFVVNHNNTWKIPYWVAYSASDSSLKGTARRVNKFKPDPELSVGERSELKDYRKSGYDKGHNAPAGDFKRSKEAMAMTFLLSNTSPQRPKLNRNKWRRLEKQIRDMIMTEGEAWIITGNVFMSPDSHLVNPTVFIGPDKVAVPTHCFKALLFRDRKGVYKMNAFLMPNQKESIPGSPDDYQISVDRLEAITGDDFFPKLPDSLENRLESGIYR